MEIPGNLKYTGDHHWVQIDGDKVFVGITDYAQKDLGEMIFLDMPETGTIVFVGDVVGVLESEKNTADFCAPISGEVLEVNDELVETPEAVNSAPYENWLITMSISDEGDLEALMDAEEYAAYCSAL